MTLPFNIPDKTDPRWTRHDGVYVRKAEGTVKWNAGDEYTIKVTAGQTGGSLGFVTGTIPPGGGPEAHAHAKEDEAFYLLSGELEFLNGDQVFTADAGDFVFIPRGNRHRFKNTGATSAELLFLFTPGGQEGFFLETGDDVVPGKTPEPWSPERYTRVGELIELYGNTLLPEDS
ncbi:MULTISPECIES: cupin domain-containing protein [unclassified Streptomyces]|uniref:cupin domain-containing protein n=1 Tax=unclassified Streptomyces TaxID=2593676 RepID=UPI0036EBAE8A